MVFTDLVRSTDIKPELPGNDITERNREYTRTVLEPHRERVRALGQNHGMRVVKTEGDAFFLVFNNPLHAAQWATDTQASHRNDPIPTGTGYGNVQVKIGMHTGAPLADPDDAEDYIGQEVDYAARVAALANAGQITLSEVTANFVNDAQITGFSTHNHGERNLKGIGRKPVYELLYPDKPAPGPLKEAALSPDNLSAPRPLHLIGRDHLLVQLREHIVRGDLIILRGEGGIGKTALALSVAHTAHDAGELEGGVAWINCEIVDGFDACIREAAFVFFGDRCSSETTADVVERVSDHLRNQRALIVLDNLEVLSQDTDLLRWLADARPPMRMLVMTREVPQSLGNRQPLHVDVLAPEDSEVLFIRIAKSNGWDEHDAARIPQLCELIGNLPLAIELLAAHAGSLPLSELERSVRASLDILRTDNPLANERHRSISACIRVSFDRLSNEAQSLLKYLCLLPDGAGSAHMRPYTGIEQWHQPISECVRHHLLKLRDDRYRFHSLVRQFAMAELGNEREVFQRRFISYYLNLTEENGGPDNISDLNKLDQLAAEWRNIIAAAETAKQLNDWDSSVRLVAGLTEYLQARGSWGDGVRLNELALAASRSSGNRSHEGAALNNLGIFYQNKREYDKAAEAYEQSAQIKRELRDNPGLARTLNNMGIVHQHRRRFDDSLAAHRASLTIKQQLGDERGIASSFTNIGDVLREMGDLDNAEAALRSSVDIYQRRGDARREAGARYNLGTVLAEREKWVEAEECFHAARQTCSTYGFTTEEGHALRHLALLHCNQGKNETALDYARQALEVLEQTEDEATRTELRELIAELEQALNSPEQPGDAVL